MTTPNDKDAQASPEKSADARASPDHDPIAEAGFWFGDDDERDEFIAELPGGDDPDAANSSLFNFLDVTDRQLRGVKEALPVCREIEGQSLTERRAIQQRLYASNITRSRRGLRALDKVYRRTRPERLCTRPRHCARYRFGIPPANGCRF